MAKRAYALAVSDQLMRTADQTRWLRAEVAELRADAFLLGDVTVGDAVAREVLAGRGARTVVYGTRVSLYAGEALRETRERKIRNPDHEMLVDLEERYFRSGWEIALVVFERIDADPEDMQIARACARWYCVPVIERLYDGEWLERPQEEEAAT